MKAFGGRKPMVDETGLSLARYWQTIGGSGISPDILALTGFWSESIIEKMRQNGLNTSNSVEQIYGGIIRFQPLPGKKWATEFDEIMRALHKILQLRRHMDHVSNTLKDLLREKWHEDDMSYLPPDLDRDKLDAIIRQPSYLVSDDPDTARQIISMIQVLESMKTNPAYWSGIYTEANVIFGRMVLEAVSLSLSNLSMRDAPKRVSLEELAEHATEAVIDGGELL